jgi:hypothetical protein
MDLQTNISWALSELERTPYPWRGAVQVQLRYCADVLRGAAPSDRLEQLNMGYVVLRELDGEEPNTLGKVVSEIQYDMQQQFLSYAAKVRLGIHKR